jgi:hypothetical protein
MVTVARKFNIYLQNYSPIMVDPVGDDDHMMHAILCSRSRGHLQPSHIDTDQRRIDKSIRLTLKPTNSDSLYLSLCAHD